MVRSCAALFAFLTFGLLATATHAGLVAHYTFDDADVEGDVVKDVSGNGLNGIKMNGGPTTGVPGRIGQAAQFEGGSNNEDNHYVDLSEYAEVFGQLSEGTLAAWVKPATAEEAGNTANCSQDEVCHFTDVLTIFAASDSTQPSAEMRWVVHTATSPFNPVGPGGAANGSQYLGIRGADFPNHLISDVADDVSLLDGEWHHVAVSVDGDNLGAMYIDGQQVEAFYQSGEELISFMADILPDGPDTVGIGRNKDSTPGGGQWFYQGLIDDLRVYDQALLPEDVRSLFESATVTVPGDFNGDGLLTAADIDALTEQSANGLNSPTYDLNSDALVNVDDVNVWVKDLFKSWVGDANLDREFNSTDLVEVLASGTYEADVDSVWTKGDFDGSGRTNSSDLIAALADGGYELGPPMAAQAVPEPDTLLLALVGLLSLLARVAPWLGPAKK